MTHLNRRDFVRLSAAAAASAGLGNGLQPAGAAESAKPAAWDGLVRAASGEGALVLYGPPAINGMYDALVTRFQKAYPAIKVTGTYGFGGELGARITAERAAGRYIPDVIVIGTSLILLTLKPAGALVPLEPYILLPEILNRNAWFQNQLWWTDAARPLTNYMFEGEMIPVAYVNTSIVKLAEFTSYWDLTNPKWKGKIVSNDIRANGPGGVPARFIYNNPGLGRPWFERFFGLDVRLSRDQRQIVDWLVQGQYAIATFIDTDTAQIAIDQGLPIAPVPIAQFKEGGAVGPDAGSVAALNNAPHPNAAKLYVNWLLSRDGQIAWQEETKTPSLRIDIPKQNLHLLYERKNGVTYENGGAEKYIKTGAAMTEALVAILPSGK